MAKSLKLFLILSFGIFFIMGAESRLYATSGACSYHGGVDCGAGQTSSGNVICKDGWTGSSVPFYMVDECMMNNCPTPIDWGCKTENDYGILAIQLNQRGTSMYSPEIASGALQACRSQIIQYQADTLAYQACLSKNSGGGYYSPTNYQQQSTSLSDICIQKYGGYSIPARDGSNACSCATGYAFGKDDQCVLAETACHDLHGDNSWYDKVTGKCSYCTGVSVKLGNSCVTPDQYCKGTYGSHSQLGTRGCSCEVNYNMTSSGCALKETRKISSYAKLLAESGGSCTANPSLSQKDISDCVDYEFHRDTYIWEVSDDAAPDVIPTVTHVEVKPPLVHSTTTDKSNETNIKPIKTSTTTVTSSPISIPKTTKGEERWYTKIFNFFGRLIGF